MHDRGNRLMDISCAAPVRTDRAGRMTQLPPGPGGDWSGAWSLKWDAWSRIVEAEHGGQGLSVAYSYDGLHRCITRHTNLDEVTLHTYYNDQWRPVEERRNAGTSAHISYLWGARHRDDLVRRDRAVDSSTFNETRYVLMDYFSPAAITDEQGEVTERYTFSAFGLRTLLTPAWAVRSSSECAMEFAFQGQFEDVETGWLNYGYRYYMPWLGRWTCKDPIGEEGGVNLFLSANNNMINHIDHVGLLSLPVEIESFPFTWLIPQPPSFSPLIPLPIPVPLPLPPTIFPGPLPFPTPGGPSVFPTPPSVACLQAIERARQSWANPDLSRSDHYRHCFAHCNIEQDCPGGYSEIGGIIVEATDYLPGQSGPSGEDFAANAAGRDCADTDCYCCCGDHYP